MSPPKKRARSNTPKATTYIGVRRRNNGKYGAEAYDPKERKNVWIGTFDTEEEAAKAHDLKALELQGENATLNFPELVDKARSSLSLSSSPTPHESSLPHRYSMQPQQTPKFLNVQALHTGLMPSQGDNPSHPTAAADDRIQAIAMGSDELEWDHLLPLDGWDGDVGGSFVNSGPAGNGLPSCSIASEWFAQQDVHEFQSFVASVPSLPFINKDLNPCDREEVEFQSVVASEPSLPSMNEDLNLCDRQEVESQSVFASMPSLPPMNEDLNPCDLQEVECQSVFASVPSLPSMNEDLNPCDRQEVESQSVFASVPSLPSMNEDLNSCDRQQVESQSVFASIPSLPSMNEDLNPCDHQEVEFQSAVASVPSLPSINEDLNPRDCQEVEFKLVVASVPSFPSINEDLNPCDRQEVEFQSVVASVPSLPSINEESELPLINKGSESSSALPISTSRPKDDVDTLFAGIEEEIRLNPSTSTSHTGSGVVERTSGSPKQSSAEEIELAKSTLLGCLALEFSRVLEPKTKRELLDALSTLCTDTSGLSSPLKTIASQIYHELPKLTVEFNQYQKELAECSNFFNRKADQLAELKKTCGSYKEAQAQVQTLCAERERLLARIREIKAKEAALIEAKPQLGEQGKMAVVKWEQFKNDSPGMDERKKLAEDHILRVSSFWSSFHPCHSPTYIMSRVQQTNEN